jgi:hypothetical protein
LLDIIFIERFNLGTFFFKIAHNGFGLGDVAEIEAQKFSFAQKFN